MPLWQVTNEMRVLSDHDCFVDPQLLKIFKKRANCRLDSGDENTCGVKTIKIFFYSRKVPFLVMIICH